MSLAKVLAQYAARMGVSPADLKQRLPSNATAFLGSEKTYRVWQAYRDKLQHRPTSKGTKR
jgi:hypothetical protein